MSLDSWSDVIQAQGEESRANEAKRLANTQANAESTILKVKSMTDDVLVQTLVQTARLGDSNPRILEIHNAVVSALESEVRKRLKKKR
jgi:hypothetical protein